MNYLKVTGRTIKKTFNQVQIHPFYPKVLEWGKLVGITGGVEVFVKAIGFVSGILLIRLLPIEEYALYTLANTMLGTMTVLADGGISAGVMSQGGKVWQNKEKLGVVLATGLDLRRKFAVGSLLVSLPILIYLLMHHEASILITTLITISLIPAFYAALSDSLLSIVPKLHQDIRPLQKNQLMVGVGRLFLTASFIVVFPFTFIALLANGFPRMYGNIQLRKISGKFADLTQKPDPVVRTEILSVVKRILPGAIYYCLSGQITIWLLSIFGDTYALAQIGALERFIMALSLIQVLVGTLAVPRFARLPLNKRLLVTRSFQIISGIIVFLLMVITMFYWFSDLFLWVLGNKYSGLQYELVLCIAGGCLNLLTGVIFSLYTSRGWVVKPILSISLSLCSVILGIWFFDISTLTGVLYYNIFLAIVQVLINGSYLFHRLKLIN